MEIITTKKKKKKVACVKNLDILIFIWYLNIYSSDLRIFL